MWKIKQSEPTRHSEDTRYYPIYFIIIILDIMN